MHFFHHTLDMSFHCRLTYIQFACYLSGAFPEHAHIHDLMLPSGKLIATDLVLCGSKSEMRLSLCFVRLVCGICLPTVR